MISDALQEILLENVSKDKKTTKNNKAKTPKVKKNETLAEEISSFIKDFKSKKIVEKLDGMKTRKARVIGSKPKKKIRKAKAIKHVELPQDKEHKIFTSDKISDREHISPINNKVEEPKPNKMTKRKVKEEVKEAMVSIDTLTEDEFFDYMINGEQPSEYLELVGGNVEAEFDAVEELDDEEEAHILDLVRDKSISAEDREALKQAQIKKDNPAPVVVEPEVEINQNELIGEIDPINIEEIPEEDDIASIMNKLSSISFEETPYEEPVEELPPGTQAVPMGNEEDNEINLENVPTPMSRELEEDSIAGMPADGTTNGLGVDSSMVTKKTNTNMPMDSRNLSEFQTSIQQTLSEKTPQAMSNNEFSNVDNIPEVGMDLSSEAEAIMNKFKSLETE